MKFTDEYKDAISRLHPSSAWGFSDDKLNWQDDSVKEPTDEEIKAEIARYDKEFADNKYQRDRASEYPSIPDQLDEIYHNGIDSWKAIIKQTKDKYPKG